MLRKLAVLAGLLPAAFLAVPASAAELPLAPGAVTSGATATVQQLPTAVGTTVTAASATVDATVRQATEATAPVPATTAEAVKPVVDAVAPPAPSPPPEAPASKERPPAPPAPATPTPMAPRTETTAARPAHPRQGSSSGALGKPDGTARRPAPGGPARSTGTARDAGPLTVAPARDRGAVPVAVEGTRAPSDDPAAPDRRGPAAGGTFASGAPAGPLFAGGVALLAIALSLAGPALSRRLVIRPAFCRSAAFVSPLERPG